MPGGERARGEASAARRVRAEQRINAKREFFRIDSGQAVAILRLLHRPDATEELASEATADAVLMDALREARSRRPNLNVGDMGIPPGPRNKRCSA